MFGNVCTGAAQLNCSLNEVGCTLVLAFFPSQTSGDNICKSGFGEFSETLAVFNGVFINSMIHWFSQLFSVSWGKCTHGVTQHYMEIQEHTEHLNYHKYLAEFISSAYEPPCSFWKSWVAWHLFTHWLLPLKGDTLQKLIQVSLFFPYLIPVQEPLVLCLAVAIWLKMYRIVYCCAKLGFFCKLEVSV